MQWIALALFALLPPAVVRRGLDAAGNGTSPSTCHFNLWRHYLFRYRARFYAPVLRTAAAFVVANLYMLSKWAVVDLFNGHKPYGSLQEFLYLGAFVAIATFVSRAASGSEPGAANALKWAAPVACASVVLGFSLAMLVNGVNPAAVLSRTIASRAENYVGAAASLKDHWLTGGVQTNGVNASSHNFIVDSWLRSGKLTAIPAAVIVIVLVALWVALLSRLTAEAEWLVPVAAALALPLVRLGTSGGGLIPPIEWVALAFVFGVLCERRRRLGSAIRGEPMARVVPQ